MGRADGCETLGFERNLRILGPAGAASGISPAGLRRSNFEEIVEGAGQPKVCYLGRRPVG